MLPFSNFEGNYIVKWKQTKGRVFILTLHVCVYYFLFVELVVQSKHVFTFLSLHLYPNFSKIHSEGGKKE